LISLIPLLALAAASFGESKPIVILDVGTYTKTDLPGQARSSGWLALCPGSNGTDLRPVNLRVVPFRSEILEDPPGQKSGREVKATECPKAYVLLKAPGLKPGAVVSAQRRGDELVLGPDSYVARTEGPPADVEICDGKIVKRYVLSRGQRRQVLLEGDLCSVFTLRWAGDLDGDGRLDLVLDENLDSGATILRVFLSRDATGAAMVREAAKTEHGGC
jgi:hypothetical protein